MSEPLLIIATGCVIACFFGVISGTVLFYRKKYALAEQEVEIEQQLTRLENTAAQFDKREPRFVVVKPCDPQDAEYLSSLNNIAESSSFQWFMYEIREKAIQNMKAEDATEKRLVQLAAFVEAIDTISAALAYNSQALIDLYGGNTDEEILSEGFAANA